MGSGNCRDRSRWLIFSSRFCGFTTDAARKVGRYLVLRPLSFLSSYLSGISANLPITRKIKLGCSENCASTGLFYAKDFASLDQTRPSLPAPSVSRGFSYKAFQHEIRRCNKDRAEKTVVCLVVVGRHPLRWFPRTLGRRAAKPGPPSLSPRPSRRETPYCWVEPLE
jgi:hypothetical protein